MITLNSFGFRTGQLPRAQVVVDCRALPNPHRRLDLRPRTGLDAEVQAYVFSTASAAEMLVQLRSGVLGGSIMDGSVIAFGCHGGRHRSVAMAERFRLLLVADGHDVSIEHLGLRPR